MSWSKRACRDVKELMSKGFKVYSESGEDDEVSLGCFLVDINGPKDTPYEGLIWTVRFTIPTEFPFKSPSVGFVQNIYHPNVDEGSGSVCLDSLNTGWIPSFTLRHIVEDLLPFLLTYPNPDDPLNRAAAHSLKNNKNKYLEYARTHSLANSKHGTNKASKKRSRPDSSDDADADDER